MAQPTLAELIDTLFRTHHNEQGREYSTYEVARKIEEMGYGKVNPSHLAKLRRGESANPSRDLLLRLCLFFQVPASYFFPELTSMCAEEANPIADPETQISLAFRSMGFDPDTRTHLEALIRTLHQQSREE